MEEKVYDDCWQLLQRFERATYKSQNARFELFSQCWLEMQMQHIYSAQTNHIEVMETTLAALHVAKRIACGRKTNGELFQASRAQRIGGIYLLYAIFNKQPTKHYVKIEVSQRTWEELSNYVEQLRLQTIQQSDTQQVSYIFWKLVQDNAFLYTALDYCQALDALAAYDSLERFAVSKQMKSNSSVVLKQQLKPSRTNINVELQGISEMALASKPLCNLQEAYNKQMLPHRSSFSATQIFSQLQDVFFEMNDLLTTEQQPTTSSASTTNQLDKRMHIRHKAFHGEEKATKSTDEESEQPLPKLNDPHERRMSSATIFGRRLPEDVIRDLKS